MIKKLLRNYYIKNSIIIAMALLLLSSSIIGAFVSYDKCKTTFYKNIDQTLKNTAKNSILLLSESFHDRAIGEKDINSSEDNENIRKLSLFSNEIEYIAYIYTLIQTADGKMYFTSSSATDEDVENDEIVPYFYLYEEATDLLKNVLTENRIVYEESTDKWGTFRTVFIPMKTENGNRYVIGADIEISYINKELGNYLKSTIVSFTLIMFILFGLGFYFWQISKEELKEISELQESLEKEIYFRTKALFLAKKEIEKTHKNTRDSIKFASLIQQALLPNLNVLENYTKESFAFWKPKDTVGGDIYFVTELDSGSEIIIMVIDGAGHGVPGAFVTMLVKAIETQIIGEIKAGTLKPNPALILEYFNRTIKTMLKQEKGSKSNTGFDGGILYFNRKMNICKYAGAKTPLYIIQDGKLEVIKSDRKNVGFVRTKIDQKYTEYDIEIKEGTQLYLATDGIIDQEGEDDERYGKVKFEKLILENHTKTISKQKDIIQKDFKDFKSDFEQSDDITVIGIKF